jgi:hypothetical protein
VCCVCAASLSESLRLALPLTQLPPASRPSFKPTFPPSAHPAAASLARNHKAQPSSPPLPETATSPATSNDHRDLPLQAGGGTRFRPCCYRETLAMHAASHRALAAGLQEGAAAAAAAGAAASVEGDEGTGNAGLVVLDRRAVLGNEASRLEAEQVRVTSAAWGFFLAPNTAGWAAKAVERVGLVHTLLPPL